MLSGTLIIYVMPSSVLSVQFSLPFCHVSRYARENLALVNVYIKDPAVTQVLRDQKVPLIWFVANIGGILGLTMGMSLVTIFEIMHHIAMLFFRTGAKSLATIR